MGPFFSKYEVLKPTLSDSPVLLLPETVMVFVLIYGHSGLNQMSHQTSTFW